MNLDLKPKATNIRRPCRGRKVLQRATLPRVTPIQETSLDCSVLYSSLLSCRVMPCPFRVSCLVPSHCSSIHWTITHPVQRRDAVISESESSPTVSKKGRIKSLFNSSWPRVTVGISALVHSRNLARVCSHVEDRMGGWLKFWTAPS